MASRASVTSLTVASKSMAVTTMSADIASLTRLTTNWPVARIFSAVSFSTPSLRPSMLTASSGGSPLIALKNE